ncbi:MAG: hypothetical protein PHR35_23370, partial [Kiritimatiellae bacterium]|nr:hypothetical protein [Kiritimatiellia bacterium]
GIVQDHSAFKSASFASLYRFSAFFNASIVIVSALAKVASSLAKVGLGHPFGHRCDRDCVG